MDIFTNLYEFSDVGLLVVRIAVGVIFLVHGTSKWSTWRKPAEQGAKPNPMLPVMRLLAVVEPLGGLAILLGFLTPLAAIGLGVIMLGAMYFKIAKWNTAFTSQQTTGWEFDVLILACCIMLLLMGPGMYSLDVLLGLLAR